MAKNLSTKSQRIVDEVSAKDFSSPRLRRQRIFNLILSLSAKLIFSVFFRLVDVLSQRNI